MAQELRRRVGAPRIGPNLLPRGTISVGSTKPSKGRRPRWRQRDRQQGLVDPGNAGAGRENDMAMARLKLAGLAFLKTAVLGFCLWGTLFGLLGVLNPPAGPLNSFPNSVVREIAALFLAGGVIGGIAGSITGIFVAVYSLLFKTHRK